MINESNESVELVYKAEFYVEKTVFFDSDGMSEDDAYTLVFNSRNTEIPDLHYTELKRLYEFLGKYIKKEYRFIQAFNKFKNF